MIELERKIHLAARLELDLQEVTSAHLKARADLQWGLSLWISRVGREPVWATRLLHERGKGL